MIVVMIVIFDGRFEGLRFDMTAMAGTAGDRRAGAVHLADVLGVDLLGHLVHEASGGFLRLGVVGVVEARTSVGANVLGVGGMAGRAASAKVRLPLMHDLVNLVAREVLGQDLEIGGRGIRGMDVWRGRLRRWLLSVGLLCGVYGADG